VDKFFAVIFEQISYTAQLINTFFKGINITTLLLSIAVIYVIFLRKWMLRKIISFSSVLFLFFILLVRVEAYLTATFGAESSQTSIGISRTVFLIIASVVLIYNTAIKD